MATEHKKARLTRAELKKLIEEAVDGLLLTNEKITVRSVHAALGHYGSLTTISEILNEIREERTGVDSSAYKALPKELQPIFYQFWEQVLELAKTMASEAEEQANEKLAESEEAREALHETITSLETALAAEKRDHEAAEVDLIEYIEADAAKKAEIEGLKIELKQAREANKNELKEKEKLSASFLEQISKLTESADKEKLQNQQVLERVQSRLDASEAKREGLEATMAGVQSQLADAREALFRAESDNASLVKELKSVELLHASTKDLSLMRGQTIKEREETIESLHGVVAKLEKQKKEHLKVIKGLENLLASQAQETKKLKQAIMEFKAQGS